MGKARVEIWNRANTSKLSDTFLLDGDLQQRNIDDLAPTGAKLNQSGGGGFTLQADHPAVTHIQPGRTVRLLSDTTPVHTFSIRERERVAVAKKHSERVVIVDGEDLADRWEHSVVDPWRDGPIFGDPVTADRVFNWASPPLNRSSWGSTLFLADRSVLPQRIPKAWPVAPQFAAWVWTRSHVDNQPVGDCLFTYEFTLDADAQVVFYATADNTVEPWIDGIVLDRSVDTAAWQDTHRWQVPCEAGTHLFAAKARNTGFLAGFLAAAFTVTNEALDEPLFSTNAETNGGWRFRDYPDPKPGFTAPQILQMLLDEAQARNELPGWTIEVHGTHPQIPEFATRVGTSYRSVLEALASSDIDYRTDLEGLTLHVWPKGQMGTATGIELDAITKLSYITTDDVLDRVQGVWSDGVRWRPTSVGSGEKRSDSVALGSVTEPAAVDRILDARLVARSEPSVSIVGELQDSSGKTAGIDYRVGDTATIEGSTVRCVGISWRVNRAGDLIPNPEWETLSSLRRRERDRAFDRLVARFDAPASASLLSSKPLAVAGRPATSEFTWSWSDDIEEALNEIDPEKPWQIKQVEKVQRFDGFVVEIDADDLPDAYGETKVRLLRNGAAVNALYDLSLTTTIPRASVKIWGYETVRPGDKIQVQCLEEGGHWDGTVTVYLADAV